MKLYYFTLITKHLEFVPGLLAGRKCVFLCFQEGTIDYLFG